jgi:hypothetical protein
MKKIGDKVRLTDNTVNNSMRYWETVPKWIIGKDGTIITINDSIFRVKFTTKDNEYTSDFHKDHFGEQ